MAAAPEGRVSRAVHAEWTKLRTLPSTGWLLLGTAVTVVVVGALAVASVSVDLCATPSTCAEDTTKLALVGLWPGQAVAAVVGVLAFGNEYGTRLITVTAAAVPRRLVVLVAKSATVAATVAGASVLGVAAALAAARTMLPGNGFTAANGYPPLSVADGPTLRASVGSVLYLTLVALLALGVAAVARDTAGALTAVLLLLYAVPALTSLVDHPIWHDRLLRWSPVNAGMAIQATRDLDGLAIGPWAGLGVLAAYAAAALVLGGVLFARRDA
jgi:ABC-2 type transport system permease protein